MEKPLVHTVRIPAAGLVFINGMSSAYSTDYPHELGGVVSERDYGRAVKEINATLADYWPCLLCFACGFGCCACTLGLSLFCPNLCISDVRVLPHPCAPGSARVPPLSARRSHIDPTRPPYPCPTPRITRLPAKAEGYLRQQLERINAERCFKSAGVRWDLRKSWAFPCPTSWIELSFCLPEQEADLLNLLDHEEEV